MSSKNDYEVVVMGGGPSGSACATFLAQRGHRVLLLEKETETRFKVGESMLPALWEYWDKLGVTEQIERAGFPIKRGVLFKISDGQADQSYLLRTDEFPQYFPRPYTFHVDRITYDRILLDNARDKGAHVQQGATVKEVSFTDGRANGVVYETADGARHSVPCDVVVDATGRSTLLASKLERRYPHPKLRKVAFYTHFDNAGRRANEDGSTVTDIHSTDGGWIWCIPLRDGLTSIGTVFDGSFVKRSGASPEALFEAAIAGSPEIAGWLAGATQRMELQRISSISYLSNDLVGDGFLMIGDASLFIDPIFSAGVTIATRAADFAAQAISEALARGDTSAAAFKDYERKIRHPLAKVTKMIVNWYAIMERKDRANIFEWSRTEPMLRERLIVLLSGGYDKFDLDTLEAWS
jgi:FAD-dependent halogenase